MLSFAPLLLMLAGGAVQAEDAAPDEIVVIGRKLQDWRGHASSRGGVTRCVTRQSTGDAEIDAIGCTALIDCFTRFEPEFRAVSASGTKRAERKQRNAAIFERMTPCFGSRRAALVAELADRRAGGS